MILPLQSNFLTAPPLNLSRHTLLGCGLTAEAKNENERMRLVETIPGMGRGEINENDGGVNSTMIHCKNFCKCHNVPPAQQQ
jgi:hypothetical protein